MEIAGKLALLRRVAAGVRAPADLKALPQQVDDLLVGQHGVVLAVADAGGAPLFAYPSAVFPQGWEASAVARATPGDAPFLRWDRDGASYRGLVEAMPTASAALPALVVGVGLDIEHHQQFMQALRDALLPALAACLALAGLLTWLATRHGLAPLRDMAGVAKGISASRLDQRLAVDTVPKELVDLAASFNGMLGRLEDSFRRLQEFSADIAHDMRTPVSNLMMQAQVAVSRARGPEEYREVLYSAIEEYDRLARMISDMLFLARADNGQLVPGRERLDLAQEMGALCEFYEPVATERGVRLLLHRGGGSGGRPRDAAPGVRQPAVQRAAAHPRRRRGAHRDRAGGRRGGAGGDREPRPADSRGAPRRGSSTGSTGSTRHVRRAARTRAWASRSPARSSSRTVAGSRRCRGRPGRGSRSRCRRSARAIPAAAIGPPPARTATLRRRTCPPPWRPRARGRPHPPDESR